MANELGFEITSEVTGAIKALDNLTSALSETAEKYSNTIKSVGEIGRASCRERVLRLV